MPDKTYLDDSGRQYKVYLDEQGNETKSYLDEKAPDLKVQQREVTDPNAPVKSMVGKVWEGATTPLANIRSGHIKELTDQAAQRPDAFGKAATVMNTGLDFISGLSSPLNVLAGGLEIGAPIAALRGAPTAAKLMRGGAAATAIPTAVEGAQDISKGNYGRGAVEIGLGGMGLAGLRNVGKMRPEVLPPEMPKRMLELPSARIEMPPPSERTLSYNAKGIPVNQETGKITIPRNNEMLNKGVSGPAELPSRQRAVPETINTQAIKSEPVPEAPKKPELTPNLYDRVNNFSKTTMTGYDLSAPGRNAKRLIATKAYWKSFKQQYDSWGSQEASDMFRSALKDRQIFKEGIDGSKSYAQQIGLDLPGITNPGREEFYNNSAAERLWGIKRGERAHSDFMNKIRADHAQTLLDSMEAAGLDPYNDLTLGKQVAKFVNEATGRGNLGFLKNQTENLNRLMFSPKFQAASFQILDPRNYATTSPVVRRQYWKSLLATSSFQAAMAGLGSLAGADVSLDPTSSKFARPTFGKVAFDFSGGAQPPAVLIAKLTNDLYKKHIIGEETKFGQSNGLDMAGNYIANRASPVASYIAAMLRGKEPSGAAFSGWKSAIDRIAPMAEQDIINVAQENPELLPIAIPAALGGEGVYVNQK